MARNFKGNERNINNLTYYWLFDDVCSKFKSVVYVMGNHEHYKNTFTDTEDMLKEALAEYDNLHILNNNYVKLYGVKFIGATLWTNMNKNCPLTKNHLMNYMNDFRIIKYRDLNNNYFKFSPEIAYSEHRLSVNYIGHQLADEPNVPTVVVTHHAPSMRSVHEKYSDQHLMNGGYASDLEHMMTDNVKLWCHGHMHDSFDYMVNNTRVVCNPLGYPGEKKDPNTRFVIEV
jgi:Icc-related predicted phosphoesterase